MTLDSENDILYLLNIAPEREGEIFFFNPNEREIIKTFSYDASSNSHLHWFEHDSNLDYFIVAGEHIVQVLDQHGDEINAFSLSRRGGLQALLYDSAQKNLITLWLEYPTEGVVAASSGVLEVYDISTGSVVNELPFGRKPHRLTFDPVNRKLYIPNGDASVLWRIDANTYSQAVPIRLGDSVEQIVIGDGGKQIFVNSRLGGSYILCCNFETNKWDSFTSGTWPIPIRSDAVGEKLFVLNAWDSTLCIYDIKNKNSLIANISLSIPRGSTDRIPDLTIDNTNKRAYVAYPEFGKIIVTDLEAFRVLSIVSVSGFTVGDVEGGVGQLQIAVNENTGAALCLLERRATPDEL
jgi:DNA-binding beta-propeller fold protein YncE